ncbi:Lipoprotein E precursor [Gimesia panareensis]|uniref:Lipoprotein E n=1 Tax=Gimesia panareensis TaxID=2527978 RepID=A0A518FK74_9PLAN|nr:HAD family acid phosphatase [Gimesia panareensis]QDV16736.1 Lipoprotein E precursor [Gimesia panareensis]
MLRFVWLLIFACGLPHNLFAQETASPAVTQRSTDQGLDATLWMQTSVEHDVACTQSYRLAWMQVRKALRDPCWTAAVEQTAGYAGLPPAVILDLDETVINNGVFMGELVRKDVSWNPSLWNTWVLSERGTAVPGAKEFLNQLRAHQIAIFFITNREAKHEAATVSNLSQMLGWQVSPEQVLLRAEKPEWTSNKSSRRAQVARCHRILLLVGDDFNDFVYQGKLSPQERIRQGRRYQNYWGSRWVILPNPVYGDWETALYHYDSQLPTAEKLQLKLDALAPRTDQ